MFGLQARRADGAHPADRRADPADRIVGRSGYSGRRFANWWKQSSSITARASTRIAGNCAQAGPAGETLVRSLRAGDLIGSLLLLYGLHPEDFETRVQRADGYVCGVSS